MIINASQAILSKHSLYKITRFYIATMPTSAILVLAMLVALVLLLIN